MRTFHVTLSRWEALIMKERTFGLAALLAGLAVAEPHASGQAGIYGIIERVVFEPSDGSPDRVQVWGAFALIERMPSDYRGANDTHVQGQTFTNYQYQPPTRGYRYFKLPETAVDSANAKREWADLASVAGTRQAVAFGYWDRFRGDTIMQVRPASAKPSDPDVYLTNVGVATLGRTGNHAAIVAGLLKLVRD